MKCQEVCLLLKGYFSFTKSTKAFIPAQAQRLLRKLLTFKIRPTRSIELSVKTLWNQGLGTWWDSSYGLKYCCILFAGPICDLYNTSLTTSIFRLVSLLAFKSAHVVLINKLYLSIFSLIMDLILTATSKVFEALFLDRIKFVLAVIISLGSITVFQTEELSCRIYHF